MNKPLLVNTGNKFPNLFQPFFILAKTLSIAPPLFHMSRHAIALPISCQAQIRHSNSSSCFNFRLIKLYILSTHNFQRMTLLLTPLMLIAYRNFPFHLAFLLPCYCSSFAPSLILVLSPFDSRAPLEVFSFSFRTSSNSLSPNHLYKVIFLCILISVFYIMHPALW